MKILKKIYVISVLVIGVLLLIWTATKLLSGEFSFGGNKYSHAGNDGLH